MVGSIPKDVLKKKRKNVQKDERRGMSFALLYPQKHQQALGRNV